MITAEHLGSAAWIVPHRVSGVERLLAAGDVANQPLTSLRERHDGWREAGISVLDRYRALRPPHRHHAAP